MKRSKATFLCALTCAIIISAGCAKKPPETPADAIDVLDITPTPIPSLIVPSIVPTIPESDAASPSPDPLFDRDGIAEPGATPPPSGEDAGTYEDYKKKNKDVIGWIKVPNTPIDYPVVLGDDNSYYLDHDANKKKNKHGAIFMDVRNKERGQKRHLILFGHRMNDKSMFGSLYKYEEEDFFKENDKITFNFDGKESTWKLFSAHRYDINELNMTATAFGSDDNFEEYMATVKKLSQFKNDVKVDGDDQVLTLLTCTKGYGKSERFVVHFKKV